MTGRLRDWMLLSRLSNLPTVATNVLAAGVIAGGGRMSLADWLHLVAAVSAIYIAGMIFNDVCDLEHDRHHQPTRPLVAGRVSAAAATAASAVLAGLGIVMVGQASLDWRGPVAAFALVAMVVVYDLHHKRNAWAPVLMGTCRGLVWITTACALTGMAAAAVVIGAVVMALYVSGLTLAARRVPAVRPNVPLLIAMISCVDAVMLAATGARWMAGCAVVAVPLTLMLQRVVPGD